MGEPIALTASDGFVLDAYRADPPGRPVAASSWCKRFSE